MCILENRVKPLCIKDTHVIMISVLASKLFHYVVCGNYSSEWSLSELVTCFFDSN